MQGHHVPNSDPGAPRALFAPAFLAACICCRKTFSVPLPLPLPVLSGVVQAYAAARFAESCMRGLDGDADVYECAYVESDVSERGVWRGCW